MLHASGGGPDRVGASSSPEKPWPTKPAHKQLAPQEFGRAFERFLDSAYASVPEKLPVFLERLWRHFGEDPSSFPVVSEDVDASDLPNQQVAIDDSASRGEPPARSASASSTRSTASVSRISSSAGTSASRRAKGRSSTATSRCRRPGAVVRGVRAVPDTRRRDAPCAARPSRADLPLRGDSARGDGEDQRPCQRAARRASDTHATAQRIPGPGALVRVRRGRDRPWLPPAPANRRGPDRPPGVGARPRTAADARLRSPSRGPARGRAAPQAGNPPPRPARHGQDVP